MSLTRRTLLDRDPEMAPERDPALGIAWIVLGGLYGVKMASEAIGIWSDTSPAARVYYATAFLCGAALAVLGSRYLLRPTHGTTFRRAAFVLPALLTINHFWGLFGHLILCLSPG